MKTREQKFAELHAQHTKAESAMIRATKKWLKLHAAVKRAEKRLDKELAEKHSQIAGKLDVRKIAPTSPEQALKDALTRRSKRSGAAAQKSV